MKFDLGSESITSVADPCGLAKQSEESGVWRKKIRATADFRVSGYPDSNWGPLRPKHSALPTALYPELFGLYHNIIRLVYAVFAKQNKSFILDKTRL